MGNPAGVRRDFGALERRRMEAAELLLKRGVSQSEVARRLGVHRQSVIRWARQLAQSGKSGLKKAGRSGRKPRLSSAQLKQIEHALKRGPEALGYASGLWTAVPSQNLNPDILMMQPSKDWNRCDTADLLRPAENPEHLYPMRDGVGLCCNTKRKSSGRRASALRRTRRGGRVIRDVSIR